MKSTVLWGLRVLSVAACLCLQCKASAVPGQPIPPMRAEISVFEDDQPFSILTLGRMGLLVVMKQNDLNASRPQRMVYFYDENLEQRWTAALPVESHYNFLGYRMEADSVRFAMTALPERCDGVGFKEIAVCLADGAFCIHDHRLDLSVLHKGVFPFFIPDPRDWHMLALVKSDYRYARVDVREDTLIEWKVASAREYECCDMQIDSLNRKVYFLFRDVRLSDGNLFLRVYSYDGRLMHDCSILPPRSDLRLLDGKLLLAGDMDFYIAGTWNMERGKQTVSPYDRGTQTMGMFAVKYEKSAPRRYWFKYYLDYPDLDTLLSSEERYKLAQAREKSNGRIILPDYLCQMRFYAQDGLMYLLGEVYDRLESTTTEVSYDFYGRMVPYTRTIFDGYRYKNAFLSVLDTSFKERANSVFDIRQSSVKISLNPLTVLLHDTSGKLLYAFNDMGIIYFRSLNSQGGFTQIRSFRLDPLYAGDKVYKSWGDGLAYWYDRYLLAYGYQQVGNTRRKGKSRQNIFYLHKLAEGSVSVSGKKGGMQAETIP